MPEETKPENKPEEPAEAGPEKPVETAESVAEEEKPKKKKKSRKDRIISKKKHTKVQVWKKYDTSGGNIVRKSKSCPRCGVGTFLAEAGNRVYCGRCGYAEIKKEDNK